MFFLGMPFDDDKVWANHIDPLTPYGGIIMRHIIYLVVAAHSLVLTSRLLAGDLPDSGEEFTKVKSEYADVLALQGTAKGEILTIAKILRAKPRIAVDQTAASGEYCFNTGLGTMVHFATQPE